MADRLKGWAPLLFRLAARTIGAAILVGTLAFPRPAAAMPKCVTGGRWLRVTSSHFTFFSDDEEGRTVEFARRLERLDEVLSLLGIKRESVARIQTYIYDFDGRACFSPFRPIFEGKVDQVDGYFQPSGDANRIAINVEAEEGGSQVLCHEYMHAVVSGRFRVLPMCMNEGLAEYFSTFSAEAQSAEMGHPKPAWLQWLGENSLMPADELFAVTFTSEDYHRGERRTTFYAESWALTHYLLSLDGGRRQLGDFLDRLAQGTATREAFESAFPGQRWDQLDRTLGSYVATFRMKFRELEFSQPFDSVRVRVEPMPARDVMFQLGTLIDQGPSAEDHTRAEEYFRAALGQDSAYAPSIGRLAYQARQRGDIDGADRYVKRALALQSRDPRIFMLAGDIALSRALDDSTWASTGPDSVSSGLLEARRYFSRAVELDPDDVSALAAYGRALTMGGKGSVEAVDILERAYGAAPARTDVLVDLIGALAMVGRRAEALALVERRLRPTGDVSAIQAAESKIFRVDLGRARDLFEQGRYVPAESLLRLVVSETTDSTLEFGLRQQLVKVARVRAANAAIDDYNRGISAYNHRAYDEALDWFERTQMESIDPKLKAEAQKRIEEIHGYRKQRATPTAGHR